MTEFKVGDRVWLLEFWSYLDSGVISEVGPMEASWNQNLNELVYRVNLSGRGIGFSGWWRGCELELVK